jgi:glycosyltransferase involved in cell wall biosynthesis
VDAPVEKIEIVIAEDHAPRRIEVCNQVNLFKESSAYQVVYHENEKNLGYDANLRSLLSLAKGNFVLFMGDDDSFKPAALAKFIKFLEENRSYNYILRSYEIEHADKKVEIFKYFPQTTVLKAGIESACFLFKRSVSIAGFTINRRKALELSTSQFDGTLLYQLHLVINIAYLEDTIFCDIPVAKVTQSFRDNNVAFGTAANETKFTPGKISQENSIRFTEGFFEISDDFDKKQGTKLSELIKKDLSRYSYPILSIQRKNGFSNFFQYIIKLANRTGINQTWHYYFYSFCLLFLGEKICDRGIILIKKKLGYTPQF